MSHFPPSCDTTMLQTLRNQALANAAGATDPLIRQQHVDLARCYADAATELREHGEAKLPRRSATEMPWRSVRLWIANDC